MRGAAANVDLFKSINDEHGHHRGDAVLRDAAEAIRTSLRPTELVYRIGGEEFLVLLPGCELERALPVARAGPRGGRAREPGRPAGHGVTRRGRGVRLTDCPDFDELFRTADRSLYEAKRAGRNRVSRWAAQAA